MFESASFFFCNIKVYINVQPVIPGATERIKGSERSLHDPPRLCLYVSTVLSLTLQALLSNQYKVGLVLIQARLQFVTVQVAFFHACIKLRFSWLIMNPPAHGWNGATNWNAQ